MPDNDIRSNNGRGAVRLENNRICVFERNGVYQARIRTEANRYLWRSLKTRNQVQSISAARKLYHSIEFRQQSGLPLTNRSVNRVLDEYVTLRERQQTQGRTSFHMLRQIKRVVKFWREYIGDQSIESVGNKELSGYIEWRKSYYAQFKTLPKNAKLNPATKHCSGKRHSENRSLDGRTSRVIAETSHFRRLALRPRPSVSDQHSSCLNIAGYCEH